MRIFAALLLLTIALAGCEKEIREARGPALSQPPSAAALAHGGR